MTFSLEQLQAFVAAAEQGSFSAAARHLGKAQSVVSVAVSHLEIDCGVELFDRSGRTPVLTAEGRALLRDARAILRRCDELRLSAAAFSQGVETRLTLALDAAVSLDSLLPHLTAFEANYARLELELLNPTSQDVAALVSSGRADLGVMFEQEFYPRGFNFTGIGHVEVIALAAPGHPLATLEQVGLSELEQHRQLMPTTRATGFRQPHELQGGHCWRIESQEGILTLLRAGFGWAYLPRSLVQQDLERGRIVALPLSFQQVDILAGIDLVWSRERAPGPAVRWLIERLSAGAAARGE